MRTEDLEKLSLRELENLLAVQQKILEYTVLYEKMLLEEDYRRRLDETRNEALDNLAAIQSELKKRRP